MTPRLRILVVDDVEANCTLISRFVRTLGHVAECVGSGEAAVEACTRERPDLVLMDIMMPGMDGHAAARAIRALCGDDDWLPIIFLSARSSEHDQLEGLALGDDYLTKPVNLAMLRARIDVLARIAAMQRRISEHGARLEAYRRRNEEELQFTRHVLDHLAGYDRDDASVVRRWVKPAKQVSGDVIAQAWAPTGTLHVMLADSTGHGLAAAMSVVPAVDAFHDMTRRGFPVNAIARELNRKLARLLPVDRFVAAAIVAIDPQRRQITLWNGGIPAALYVTWDGQIGHRFVSRHPPLGVLPDTAFDDDTEVWPWQDDGELVLCSDGLIEAEDLDNRHFGLDRLTGALAGSDAGARHTAVIDAVTTHLGGKDCHDDLSLAVVTCSDVMRAPAASPASATPSPRVTDGNWELHIRFGADDLRRDAVRPQLDIWINQIGLNPGQFGKLQLMLSELCNNAVDHGVLGLDSALKQCPEGYERFRQLRAERLTALTVGAIDVTLVVRNEGERRHLQARVCDTGPGFDYARHLEASLETDSTRPFGRGIGIVRRLADGLRYGCNGAEAIIDLVL